MAWEALVERCASWQKTYQFPTWTNVIELKDPGLRDHLLDALGLEPGKMLSKFVLSKEAKSTESLISKVL
eukprot:7335365-Ditylum_brightwellii.AAC.1